MPLIAADRLERAYARIAGAHGATPDEAAIFARALVRADLRGYTRQGAALVPYYDDLLAGDQVRFGVRPRVEREGPAFAALHGGHGVGQIVAHAAMAIAIEKASATGVAVVTVRESGDFAMAGIHALQAAERGLLGIAMSTGQPLVAPLGGREPFFCTNPVALAAPTASGDPVVVDVASSPFSMGQMVRAARDGLRMGRPVVVDADGRVGDDPRAIVDDPGNRESTLSGAIAADDAKSYGWLLIVELLGGVLSGLYDEQNGATAAGGVQGRPRFGQCFVAIDVERFLGPGAFADGADRLAAALRAVPPAQGVDAVRVPGDRAAEQERRRRVDGVPVRDEEWALVQAALRRHGLDA